MKVIHAVKTDEADRLMLYAASQGVGAWLDCPLEWREESQRLLRGLATERAPLDTRRLERALEAVERAEVMVGRECLFEFWKGLVTTEQWEQHEETRKMADALVLARQHYLIDIKAARAFLTAALEVTRSMVAHHEVEYGDDPRLAIYHQPPVSGLREHAEPF